MNTGDERSSEEVRRMIKIAKLHESDLTEVTQILSFPDTSKEKENLKLMLLDDNLLKEIEAGNELVFKGEAEETVVLCTNNKTYDVKKAETSNSLLLVPELLFSANTGVNEAMQNNSCDSDSSFDKSNSSLNKSIESDEGTKDPRKIEYKNIVDTFFTYYELKPCEPKLFKLRKLLEPTKYQGLELEYTIDKSKLMNYESLFEQVQASHTELIQELEKIQAIKIGDHYRLLDFNYEFEVLAHMLDLVNLNSWSPDRVSKDQTLDNLKEITSKTILEAMFRFYTTESAVIDGIQYYRYNQEKVCRFIAQIFLKKAKKYNLINFLQVWQDSVPEGMSVDESMLPGIALIDKNSTPKLIWGLVENDLPEDINERFKTLFNSKDKWTVDEISPYIQCYATDKFNVNSILTKYTRASSEDGIRVFSAKHIMK